MLSVQNSILGYMLDGEEVSKESLSPELADNSVRWHQLTALSPPSAVYSKTKEFKLLV